MTGPPIISIPFLRPETIHEVAGGLGGTGTALQDIGQMLAARQAQQQEQEQQQQQMLMVRGRLALEQEKFDAETSQRNEKKKQLAQLQQGLSQALQGVGQPGTALGGVAQSVPLLAGAGETSGAAAALRDIPGLQQKETASKTQLALGQLLNSYSAGDVSDPVRQHSLLLHAAAIAGPEAAQQLAEALKPISGRFTGIVGNDGDIYTLNQENGQVTKTGYNGGAKGKAGVAPARLQAAARIALQQITDMDALLKSKPDADIMPSLAAGIANAKAGTGIGGAVAGFLNPLAQKTLTPEQQMFQRMGDALSHTYTGLIGATGSRSQWLFQSIRNSVIPQGGQDNPEVRADAARIRNNLKGMFSDMAAGRTIDMTKLPYFTEAMQDWGDYQAPKTETPNPSPAFTGSPNFQDFRTGVPKS